jgi:hypothetical protein
MRKILFGAPKALKPNAFTSNYGGVHFRSPKSQFSQQDVDSSPRVRALNSRIQPQPVKFITELLSGITGYTRAGLIGDIPEGYKFKNINRSLFHEKLKHKRVPKKFRRQLQNQNYVQDLMGTDLPEKAMNSLVDKVKVLGRVSRQGPSTK